MSKKDINDKKKPIMPVIFDGIKKCERPMSWFHLLSCSPVSSASRSTLHSVLKTERQMMSVPHGSNQNACDERSRNTSGFNIM